MAGWVAAIAITTAMDANGLSAYSALPLLPLFALFWFLQRFSRAAIGLTPGRGRGYGLAVLHPIAVMGALAAAAGAVHVEGVAWGRVALRILQAAVATAIVAVLTEEGFFRGWLWASSARAGAGETSVLLWTSVAFALWHVSAVVLPAGFNPPPSQVPVFLVNAAVIGVIWGLLRRMSGSIVVTSVAHGVWNGLAYVLFGFGTREGKLGIANTGFYGPEVGVLGLLMNLLFATVLWEGYRRSE